jgi:hypothetical protein
MSDVGLLDVLRSVASVLDRYTIETSPYPFTPILRCRDCGKALVTGMYRPRLATFFGAATAHSITRHPGTQGQP